MSGINDKSGIQPKVKEEIAIRDRAMSGDIIINILTADVAPAPTAEAWDYTIKFQLEDSQGNVHNWYNSSAMTAVVADDSVAGTASVDDATPAVVNGIGTVVLSGDAADWLDTEEASVTIDGTILGKALTEKVFTVTFTA